MKAFRRAYPGGENLVVASNVDRPFERELIAGDRVQFVGLETLMDRVGGQA